MCKAPSPGLPRWFDLVAAGLGFSLLAPFLLLVWLLIRLESAGPGIFSQTRVGRGGRAFTCLKFRTMRRDAPPGDWKVANFESYRFNPEGLRDPRLTRLGAVLRKTSIDELPQLLNVIRGEMALVGPRPEIPEIVEQYPAAYHRRHLILPGITGEAQVNGRADLSYAMTIECDLAYLNHRSPRRDLLILWQTLGTVFGSIGAR
jgi:lipopolysaccharide/colanic/teichoic acid biosynthesis glycosyltransferase